MLRNGNWFSSFIDHVTFEFFSLLDRTSANLDVLLETRLHKVMSSNEHNWIHFWCLQRDTIFSMHFSSTQKILVLFGCQHVRH